MCSSVPSTDPDLKPGVRERLRRLSSSQEGLEVTLAPWQLSALLGQSGCDTLGCGWRSSARAFLLLCRGSSVSGA